MLGAALANLRRQYTPRLDYAAYAGAVARTSRDAGYGGLAAGVGGAFDGQLRGEPSSPVLASDTRVTGCLLWGPFALELGFTAQRSARVGLSAAPTALAHQLDSRGFQLNLRGFRWLDRGWELVTMPVQVNYVDVAPATDDQRQSAHLTMDSALVRYLRYGIGTAGEARLLELFPIRITGEQDPEGRVLSATMVDVGAVRATTETTETTEPTEPPAQTSQSAP